ncbi:MAG: phosphatase PAP2 family protein [Phycisphaeraceae bacterium]|nr:phosphatase PAP2 family protein [Phycisphaeraceae bacterium]
MTPWATKPERSESLARALWIGTFGAVLVVSALLDSVVWLRFSEHNPAALHQIEISGWYQTLRQAGYVPAWVAIALAIDFAGLRRQKWGWRPSAPPVTLGVVVSILIAGAAVEVLKPAIGRLRPEASGGEYVFAPLWTNPALTSYSTPSSHAAIAFAGAFALARTFPGAAWLLIGIAVGCGVTRLIAGAHYLSDIVLAALVGWLASRVAPRGVVT